ncbi:hypothetical protein [Streptomyces scabiei]|uniref:hypothetical protein n=1 Tax=Streptomyces scabiei TaxID=1930 RepID=UPI0029A9A3F4|nr:hypothetical protein [Streptomyces scabiei]MDX2538131.1 hypothetical protein [Streptomyces scabiei]MDX2859443.1 hypothetical protein [Streptomyces scabiei]MDX3827764.1 hypothetical protein [Streptomyces scabiei]
MGSSRVALCAGTLFAAALAASASPALAADPGRVSAVPASPPPGSDIQVRAAGCAGESATAVSEAFVADALLTRPGDGSLGTLTGDTRVRSSLRPGTYELRVTCPGVEDGIRGTLRVGGGRQPEAAGPSASAPPGAESGPAPRPASPASPVAPVRAGGGGAAVRLAADGPVDARGSAGPAGSLDDARHAGPGARHAVVGLVLAGVAAAVVARGARRGRGRGTE